MKVENFINALDTDFFVGVPDSKLKALCDYLVCEVGINDRHIIAANEGNAVGIAAGYYLATGEIPVVYLQNSGIGNVINPLCSLLNEKVYGIPCIFVVGWRGERGIHDEPQHVYQGEISKELLECVGCYTIVLSEDDIEKQLSDYSDRIKNVLKSGGSVAFLIRQKAFSYDGKPKYKNEYDMSRETALEQIVSVSRDDVIVSTTGKTSRELFEIRERRGEGHEKDFLTVGSMGHASSIALGISLRKPKRRIWCIDGDGAVLMHMGAMAVIGSNKPVNMVHIVINNEAHESVGGMPTVSGDVDLCKVAEGCGYPLIERATSVSELQQVLEKVKSAGKLAFVEIRCAIGSRADLGRPTTTPQENKVELMRYLED